MVMEKLTDVTSKANPRLPMTPKERYERIKHCFATKKSASEFVGKYTGKTIAICGGGPSLEHTLDELRDLKAKGCYVMAVNNTHEYLIANGIVPDFCILLDPREWVKTYVTPHKDVVYLVASQVHPAVWEKLEGYKAYVWHAYADNGGSKKFKEIDITRFKKFARGKPFVGIGGGVTAGLRGWLMAAAPNMGFSVIHFFGFDSSTSFNGLYAYKKDLSVKIDTDYFYIKLKDPLTDRVLMQSYETNFSMRQQAANVEEFFYKYAVLIKQGKLPPLGVYFHGTGLVPDWAALKGLHFDKTRAEKLRTNATSSLDMPSMPEFSPAYIPTFSQPQIIG